MKKKVNICASIPVRTVRPMIYGNYNNIEMTVEDIFTCICGRAIVDEILSDGTLVRLGLDNYNKVNEATVEEAKEEFMEAKAPAEEPTAPEVEETEASPDAEETVETITESEEAPAEEPEATESETTTEEVPGDEAPVETKAQKKARKKAEAEAAAAAAAQESAE